MSDIIPDVPFHPIERLSVAYRVRQQILAYLRANFTPGAKLPSERELSESMGVSRAAVREALQGLVMENVLSSRQGGGYFMLEVGPDALVGSSAFTIFFGDPGLEEVQEARTILEVTIAGLAAEQATPHEVEEMERLVQEAEDVAAWRGYSPDLLRLGWAFHTAIARASHNQALSKLQEVIAFIAQRAHQQSGAYEAYPWQYDAKAHRELWELIRDGDREAVEQAMRKHLAETYRLLMAASPAAPTPRVGRRDKRSRGAGGLIKP